MLKIIVTRSFDIIITTTEGVTCKPEGSCILLAFVLLDVTVMGLDRDDRLLRAEEGREDDRLSATHHRQTLKKKKKLTGMNTKTHAETIHTRS